MANNNNNIKSQSTTTQSQATNPVEKIKNLWLKYQPQILSESLGKPLYPNNLEWQIDGVQALFISLHVKGEVCLTLSVEGQILTAQVGEIVRGNNGLFPVVVLNKLGSNLGVDPRPIQSRITQFQFQSGRLVPKPTANGSTPYAAKLLQLLESL